jgi:hypothetical protein
MCQENPAWGAPRIHGELLKLGIDIGESSVSKYMVRCRKSADCTSATNDGLPEKPESTTLRAAFPRCFEIRVRTVLLEHACIGEFRSPDSPRAANCSSFAIRWGNDIRHGLHRVFGRDR